MRNSKHVTKDERASTHAVMYEDITVVILITISLFVAPVSFTPTPGRKSIKGDSPGV